MFEHAILFERSSNEIQNANLIGNDQQQDINNPTDVETQRQNNIETSTEVTNDDKLEPINKYILLTKFRNLQTKLKKNQMVDDDLEIFLKFARYFNYDTIENLGNIILNKLYKKFK
jgi:hypothetical protein